MQSNHVHLAASDGIRQGPNGPSPNGHAPESPSTAPGTGWTQLYHAWLHPMLAKLTDPELRAMLYILRNTKGWDRTSDRISQGQFLYGKANDPLDEGCGIHSLKPLRKAIAGLEEKGYIRVEHAVSARGKTLTTTFTLLLTVPDGLPEHPSPVSDGLPRHPLMGDAVTHDGLPDTPSWVTASPIDGLPRHPTKERKETSKETEKETSKENSSAGACAPRTEPPARASHPLAGDTSSSRVVEAPQETQLTFAENLVHGPRVAPSAPHHPAGETSPNGLAAGPPADKTTVTTGTVPNEPREDQTDAVWAAHLWLARVAGRPRSMAAVQEKWRLLCKPLVEAAGSRADYARWITWMEGHPWFAEDPQRINMVGAKWLAQELDTWLNLPPAKQDIPQAQAKAERAAQERAREENKHRDPRKIDNRIRGAELADPQCIDCGAALGTRHYAGCRVAFLGDTVTALNMDRPLMVEKIQQRYGG